MFRTDIPECRGIYLYDSETKDFKTSCVHFKIMNSWSGKWGKGGYAWIPSELVDWAEIGFSKKQQRDAFIDLISSGDLKLDSINFKDRKFR